MFFNLILNENVQNTSNNTVIKNNYNPLNDKNITGITTVSGNWIKKKVFVVDFLNRHKSSRFKAKKEKKWGIIEETLYSIPGDVPFTNYRRGWVDEKDDTINIAGHFFSYGGSDSSVFESDIYIPWIDIESWLNANGVDTRLGIIKSIYLVPEIKLINPPLNKAQIKFSDIQINGRELPNEQIIRNLVIPKEMQESSWTASDVFAIISKILGYASAISTFMPSSRILSPLIDIGGFTAGEISDFLNYANKEDDGLQNMNYYYTNSEENRIKIAGGIPLDYQKDLKITIPRIELTGTRDYGYWSDRTEAKLSNIYVVLELE